MVLVQSQGRTSQAGTGSIPVRIEGRAYQDLAATAQVAATGRQIGTHPRLSRTSDDPDRLVGRRPVDFPGFRGRAGSETDRRHRECGRTPSSPKPTRSFVARFGLIDRGHSLRMPRVSFKRDLGALMTHALCAEGETPDWRSPAYVGAGPFAMAVPCARVPGRYAEPRNVKNLVVHPWSGAIGSSTSAAQKSFDMVVCRRKAQPYVLITELGLRENGRPSLTGTVLWTGSCSMG
jgi:hypothetical protein